MAQSVSMKSFLVIVMFALIGFRFSSAASIDVDENEIPESAEAYKGTIETILRDASKQIIENSAFDENMLVNNFQPENMFDDEQSVTFTEEEEVGEEAENNELSPVEDNRSTENVDSGIRCSWRGLNGQCCQSLRIIRFRVRLCIGIALRPPTYFRLQLTFNGRVIWRRTVGVRQRSFNICFHRGPVRICIGLFNLHITRHYARICLRVQAKLGWIGFHKNLGCISRRFALQQNTTITNEPNPTNVHKKHNDKLSSYEYEQRNVLKFQMA